MLSGRAGVGLLAVVLATGPASGQDDARRHSMLAEIAQLRADLDRLSARESGLLGEVATLGAEIRLREAELEEVSLRLEATRQAIGDRETTLTRLRDDQEERGRYLAFRLREIYKSGPVGALGPFVAIGGEQGLEGVRYAVYLGERDARKLREFRSARESLAAELEGLLRERDLLEGTRREAEGTRARLAAKRSARERLLASIQRDRSKHQDALGELEAASRELGRLAGEAGSDAVTPQLDIRKFRGLLDWPAPGRVASGFGKTVHARFKTEVPHPGVDIAVPIGTDFRAVFNGRVAFASTLRGYGLTVIVDHGRGVVSVYTHASVLLVSSGQIVARGQVLGKTGDSGSLTGPKLYLEIRENGRPVDPAGWLRRR